MFLFMISMENGILYLFCHLLRSKLRLMLESMKVLFCFGMNFVLRALKLQIWCSSIHFFVLRALKQIWCSSFHFSCSKDSKEDPNGCYDIDSSVPSFLGFTLEIVVEVVEGPSRNWLLRRAACDWQLGWFSDESDGAILLLGFLLGASFVESLETVSCAGALLWSFSSASDADELSLILDSE